MVRINFNEFPRIDLGRRFVEIRLLLDRGISLLLTKNKLVVMMSALHNENKKHQGLYDCKFIWILQRPWFTVQFLNDPLAVNGFEDSELYINVTVYHCGPWAHNMPLHPFSSREIYLTVSRWSWFHVSGHMGNLYYCFRHLNKNLHAHSWWCRWFW